MPGGTQPPFRMPCEGVSGQPLFFLGSPFQHGNTPALVDKYTLTTAVDNWDTGTGGTIPAYERWTPDLSGGGSCETHFCNPDGAPCSPWLRPLPDNTWSHTGGEQVNFAVRRKAGFKNVQASRHRNGVIGYRDVEAIGGIDTVLACGDPATLKTYRSYKSTPNNTRYRTINIDASWAATLDGTTTTQTASVQQTINNTTGILNTDSLSVSPNQSFNDAWQQLLEKGFWTWSDIVSLFMTSFVDVTGNVITYTATGYTVTSGGDGHTMETVTWDLAAGSFERNVYGATDAVTFPLAFTETVSVSDSSFTYEYSGSQLVFKYNFTGQTLDLKVTATRSNTITESDLYADIKTLLDEWDLADDEQYPWRTDIKVGVAPMVTRDELQTQAFDATGFYLNDYAVPVVNPPGSPSGEGTSTIGDSDWLGFTGVTINPNPQTGTLRQAIDFGGNNSGSVVDIQLNSFSHSNAPITYTVVGGSFPSGVSMDSGGHITGTIGTDGRYGVTIEATCGVAAATGDILGSPKPAGYQNFFDFLFTDVRGCCFEDGEGEKFWNWYPVGWGQDVVTFNSNTGCHLPLNSTQWNNWFEAVNKPAGAWIFYADQRQDYFPDGCVSSSAPSGAGDAGNIVAQKWAEVLERWPSQNFAKPGGDMKFWYDETKVACATNVSGSGAGSVWALVDPETGVAPTFIDPDSIWGGTSVGGFYLLASWDGTNATLGAKQFDVPSNWASKSNSDDTQCFGALRWSDKPSLLGRAAIITSGTTVTFAAAQPAFGMASSSHQEQVDLYDAAMTAVASNITATRVNDSSFSTGSAYPTAVWAQIHGSPAYYFNDDQPKGDYAVLEWLADFRSFGEAGRLSSITDCDDAPVSGAPSTNAGGGPVAEQNQFASFSQTPGCLPLQPCAPAVVCISPNGESFSNGVTYEFPESFGLDATYGSKWWGYVQQTMTDLFWQPPHRPCNVEPCAKWQADDGTCLEDSEGSCPGDDGFVEGESVPPVLFYGFPPQVEVRLSLPGNYGAAQNETPAALPSGMQIGWLSPVDHVPADGDVAYPPEAPKPAIDQGIAGGAVTPWSLHASFCTSIVGGCRFDYNYPGC